MRRFIKKKKTHTHTQTQTQTHTSTIYLFFLTINKRRVVSGVVWSFHFFIIIYLHSICSLPSVLRNTNTNTNTNASSLSIFPIPRWL
ncbi:hypothetical protein RIF29_42343 [Crotalaria pallida]|uniref:Uncharacterized protein n=1 Tax=Crotalaria pallida TaxID=3830 RepID=A0AAN9E7E6_CROPI